jgi:zinc/manganese transport system substrate-binding protein
VARARISTTTSRSDGLARLLVLLALLAAWPAAGAIRIVAAENFYGDLAAQLAGPQASVSSVLTNPNTDPHLFEAVPSTARALAAADLVIYNGLGYDPWMKRLLAGTPSARRRVIEVAAALHRDQPGTNPHLWYDPTVMPALARIVSAQLQAVDPNHAAYFGQQLERVLESMRPIDTRIAGLRGRFAGTPVTATEPLAGDLAAAVGLEMLNGPFQLAVMNNTEPGAREVAEFERSLRTRRVRLVIYNSQALSGAVERLLGIARESGIPLVAMSETVPPGMHYQQWLLGELDSLERALSGARP